MADAVPMATDASSPSASEGRAQITQGGVARMLVRRASMLLEVENPEEVARRVAAVTASLGGFVEQSRESSGGRVHITVRVPAATLEAAMDSVATMGHVEKREISADDVTEQLVDLDARVATRREIRNRLRALLERAQSIEEVITVERELGRVQGELDGLERRLEYLRGSASMAALGVDAGKERIPGPLGAVLLLSAKIVEKLFVWR
jgi:hypothetical protein